MGKKTADDPYTDEERDAIIEEAREGYSLRDRLRGVSVRTKTVTLYTDAVIGAELGGAEDLVDGYGLKGARRRWGLMGELDTAVEKAAALQRQDDPDEAEVLAVASTIDDLKGKIPPLVKKLEKSALVVTARAIPQFVIRDVRRKAKKALGIKGKGIPEARQEEFGLEHLAQLVAASVDSWEDRSAGQKFSNMTLDEARALRDELPAGQFDKLDRAIGELSFESAIASNVTDTPDF